MRIGYRPLIKLEQPRRWEKPRRWGVLRSHSNFRGIPRLPLGRIKICYSPLWTWEFSCPNGIPIVTRIRRYPSWCFSIPRCCMCGLPSKVQATCRPHSTTIVHWRSCRRCEHLVCKSTRWPFSRPGPGVWWSWVIECLCRNQLSESFSTHIPGRLRRCFSSRRTYGHRYP